MSASKANAIPFVSEQNGDEERSWLTSLRLAMPDERVESFHALDPADLNTATLAVVANPNPAKFAAMPNLVWVHSVWAGVEKLVATPPQNPFAIVRLIDPELSRTMAEAALAWTFYLHRDMPAYAAQQQVKQWKPLPYFRPAERTVGLLGFGELGLSSAFVLGSAGFQVATWSRTPKTADGVETLSGPAGLERLLSRSDIVICLLPLTPQTRGLLNGDSLGKMRPGASLINFARGPIVVTEDLLSALDSGHLNHAVLDVFDEEPLPPGSPLWLHPAITVLPHISAQTNRETATRIVAANIRAYRQTGVVPASVDVDRGY